MIMPILKKILKKIFGLGEILKEISSPNRLAWENFLRILFFFFLEFFQLYKNF